MMKIREKKIVLCEGVDDALFLEALSSEHGIAGLQVEDYGGKNNLGPFLRALIKAPNFANVNSLAITRDADSDLHAALQSVSTALGSCPLVAPCAHASFAEAASMAPKVGVFIFSRGNGQGMLEDLCIASVENTVEYKCIHSFLECVKGTTDRPLQNMAKTRCHAWLSIQDRPEVRLGEAAKCGYWPLRHTVFCELVTFLKAL